MLIVKLVLRNQAVDYASGVRGLVIINVGLRPLPEHLHKATSANQSEQVYLWSALGLSFVAAPYTEIPMCTDKRPGVT